MPDADLQLEAPQPPGENECCGNGCVNCVWTVYQEKLDAYHRAQAQASACDHALTDVRKEGMLHV